MKSAAAILLASSVVEAKTYFKDEFSSLKKWTVGGEGWKSGEELGEFKLVKGDYGVDEGIQSSPKDQARFFALSAPFDSEFNNVGKDLVLSYTVKHEQNLQCGGAYIKVLKKGYEPKKFQGGEKETEYAIMFGPDLCGTSTRRTQVILNYNGKKDGKLNNLQCKDQGKIETDRLSHRYTLIIRPDNTFETQVDGVKDISGSLFDKFDFLLPKTIKDPEASKPADWVDEAEIADPSDVKPEGYDSIPRTIPDASKKKPEDWDDEEDGSWEPPMIANPDFKEWVQKKIPNPAYKGVWVHPEVPNPAFVDDKTVYNVCEDGCTGVGFELWQVQAGTIFDDVIITDSVEEAEAFAAATFGKKKDAEKKKYDEIEEAKKKEAEAAAAKAKAEADAKAAADKSTSTEAEDDDDL